MPSPSTARRRTVNRDQVTAVALEILDTEGLDGLTMAAVAKRVGFSTMAVYRHVKNRDDLIASAVEAVLGDITRDGDDGEVSWLDALQHWMDDVRAALLAHPWAAMQLGTRQGGSGVPWTKTVQVLAHHVARSGLSAHDQARALVWTTRLTVGVLILELSSPLRDERRPRGTGSALVAELATLSDDDLWADAVAQTRSYLAAMAAGP